MKEIRRICDRCGSVLTDQGSIVEIKAGELRKQISEPLDLCSDCSALFSSFLKSGQQSNHAPAVTGQPAILPGLESVAR